MCMATTLFASAKVPTNTHIFMLFTKILAVFLSLETTKGKIVYNY